MQSNFDTKGTHIICDMWGVSPKVLNNLFFLKNSMKMAIQQCGATLVTEQYKRFYPQGVTILMLLEESHFSLHTYPEKKFASLDMYVCGSALPQVAVDHMIKMLAPEEYYTKVIVRGDKAHPLMEV